MSARANPPEISPLIFGSTRLSPVLHSNTIVGHFNSESILKTSFPHLTKSDFLRLPSGIVDTFYSLPVWSVDGFWCVLRGVGVVASPTQFCWVEKVLNPCPLMNPFFITSVLYRMKFPDVLLAASLLFPLFVLTAFLNLIILCLHLFRRFQNKIFFPNWS